MTRLKETLNQMGMDVASMQVKDGQTRQNGGKSTPNQGSKSTDLVNNDSKSTNSPTISVARPKMGEDGWDVLV
jgi:flagellar hook-length control protein FliK